MIAPGTRVRNKRTDEFGTIVPSNQYTLKGEVCVVYDDDKDQLWNQRETGLEVVK